MPDVASKTVLLETAPNAGFGGDRLLLGPAQLAGKEITSAQAAFNSPDWVVNLNLSSTGSKEWDTLANEQFHAYIGMDLDAQVISAPLTFPNARRSFTSFGGKIQISGNFTESTAKSLALDLQFGALPVTLGGGPHGASSYRAERLPDTRQVLAERRPRGGDRGADPRPHLHDLLLPGPRNSGVDGPGDDRGASVGDRLGAQPFEFGPDTRSFGCDGSDRVGRYNSGLLYRLFRTIERRGARGQIRAEHGGPCLPGSVPHRACRRPGLP